MVLRDRMLLEETLARFAVVARPEIVRDHGRKSCVAATWITIEVLRILGVCADPLVVRLTVGNAAYRRLCQERGIPRTEEELDEWSRAFGAHNIGVGFEREPGGIGAHVVAIADDSYLIDSSLDQATNSANDIVPPGVLYGRIDPNFVMRPLLLLRMDTEDLFIEYSHHPNPPDIEQLPEWGHNTQTDGSVRRILAEMDVGH